MINRYKNIPRTKINGKLCYKTSRYPEIPLSINDIYVVTVDGDRFDLLANRYYGDVSLYWIISAANSNLPQNSLFPPPGTQIRIPTDVSAILAAYDKLNN